MLAKSIRRKWMTSGTINYRQASLFIPNFLEHTNYLIRTNRADNISSSNDVNNYVRSLNEYYGFTDESGYVLTTNNLANRSIVNIFNTFHLFSLYTYFKVYAFDGDQELVTPMMKLGKVNWLPSFRFGLTPFGSEYIVENFFKTDRSFIETSVRIGDNKLDEFYGGGVSYHTELRKNLKITAYTDIWFQPSMQLGGTETRMTKEGIGGRVVGEVNWYKNNSAPLGFFAQVGYKTAGYIEGEKLDQGFIL